MQQPHRSLVPATWQIVVERKQEDEPQRYAVLQGRRRVAWGLRDQEAAARWLRRLSDPPQPVA